MFPVQDSTLSATAIAERVLTKYDLPAAAQCHFFRKGICDTYRVQANKQEYFLNDEKNSPTIFDLDSSGCGWRALDIGVYFASDKWMDTTQAAETRRHRRLEAFLEGYECVRKLSKNEMVVVQLGPPIRHIFLMGVVLRYTTKYEGLHWADDNFIDWHMTWFREWTKRRLPADRSTVE